MNVVLLHGLGADHRAFQRFRRLLPKEWNIDAWDLLGHGDAPHPEHGYSLDDHAAYIASRLREASGERQTALVEPPVLIGHSYGAGTSVALTAKYPQLVRGIVLLDPVVYVRHPMGTVRSKTEQMIAARKAGSMETTVLRLFPHEAPALQRWTIETWERMAQGVVEEIDHDWMRFAPLVTTPVAIVHGDLGQGGGGDMAAEYFASPSVRRIEGAGHYLHATHARETAAAVAEAVGKVAGT